MRTPEGGAYPEGVRRSPFLLVLALVSLPLAAQEAGIQFQPRVGAIGARIHVTGALPAGAEVRFGGRPVAPLRESDGFSFLVPAGSATAFVEVVRGGKVVAKSAVPFVVTGTSLVSSPKLIGLKEAIDVFGYSEPVPEGAKKPETLAKPVLRLDDEDVLTIGEAPPPTFSPAVELSDAASAGMRSMGPAGFLITARAPKKRYNIPPPSPP